MTDALFDAVRERLAPFGFDVMLTTDHEAVTLHAALVVTAACRTAGDRFEKTLVYTPAYLSARGNKLFDDKFAEVIAASVIAAVLSAVGRRLGERGAGK